MNDFLSNYLIPAAEKNNGTHRQLGPVVTISRECGCSANRIATKLSKILTGYNYLSDTKTEVEWKWVSKEVIEMAAVELETHPDRIKNVFLGEAKKSIHEVTTAFSNEKMYDADDQQVIDTVKSMIKSIAEDGHYIIVGRAASVIAQDIPRRLSIKLQAPLDWRINRIMQVSNLSWADAQQYVLETDRQRDLFVEHLAGRPLVNTDFDLIFNYATLLDDHIVDVVINVMKNKKMIPMAEEE
ncbi:MAG TPA: cytidylate kinase-like family protein [Prolixibacteraceae bacterium]|nr:cytidylate kinase-like family protein [Prolixibacteraceae bacterium]